MVFQHQFPDQGSDLLPPLLLGLVAVVRAQGGVLQDQFQGPVSGGILGQPDLQAFEDLFGQGPKVLVGKWQDHPDLVGLGQLRFFHEAPGGYKFAVQFGAQSALFEQVR